MAYVIDGYNRWSKWDREHSIYLFMIGERQFAIKEVKLEWGQPVLPFDTTYDVQEGEYKVYGSQEEAMEYVRMIKELAR